MDQKKLEEICYELGECVRHADARSVDKRVQLVETESQPIVIKRLKPKAETCGDCGREHHDRIVQLHVLKPAGWKTWCDACKLSRQPGTDYFGIKPKSDPAKPNHLGPREELLPKPSQPQHQEPISTTIETVASEHCLGDYVEQVVVRHYHESVIREFVRNPVEPQLDQCDAPGSDSVVRTG